MKKKEIRYGMVFDSKACVGCGACVVACKTENEVPEGLHRDWIIEEVSGLFPTLFMEIRSERCNHCEHAPCQSVCPTNATHYDIGGIVLVDKKKCIGCKTCIVACPYEVRYMHPEGYVDKCSFCDHRIRKGENTACVNVCPAKALSFGNLEDSNSLVAKLLKSRKYKVLKPEQGTKPRFFILV